MSCDYNEEKLATSHHYLRYFIFGGYLAFLIKIPELISGTLTLQIISFLGISVTLICIAMDWRNYYRFKIIVTGSFSVGIVTILLTIFYIACLIGFSFFLSPKNEYLIKKNVSQTTKTMNKDDTNLNVSNDNYTTNSKFKRKQVALTVPISEWYLK